MRQIELRRRCEETGKNVWMKGDCGGDAPADVEQVCNRGVRELLLRFHRSERGRKYRGLGNLSSSMAGVGGSWDVASRLIVG